MRLPRLPEDVIIEILLRLPVKSLLRFKSVCRQWLRIITSPSFGLDHFHRGSRFTRRVFYWYGDPADHLCELDSYLDPEYKCVCDIAIDEANVCSLLADGTTLERYEVPDDIWYMHGPCKGLICVTDASPVLALWNPATRRSRRLPPCPLVNSRSEIGFGLDPITGDLKIVLFDQECNQRQFAVYSSRNDSWKLLEAKSIFGPDFCVMPTYWGCTFFDGFCYWRKFDWTASKISLLAFDIHNDVFKDLEIPEMLQECWVSVLALFDTLALLSYNRGGIRSYDIWLMKELGCWTKHSVVVLPFERITSPIGMWMRNQICAWKDDELIVHDLDSGHTTMIGFGSIRGRRSVTILPRQYKESLISV